MVIDKPISLPLQQGVSFQPATLGKEGEGRHDLYFFFSKPRRKLKWTSSLGTYGNTSREVNLP